MPRAASSREPDGGTGGCRESGRWVSVGQSGDYHLSGQRRGWPDGHADVPAWFLCTDYNDRVFHITQAFFPRTAAWDNLKRSLKGVYDDSLWEHLAGTTSAPLEAGQHGQVAVKVIDDRGNELVVVKKL